MGKISMVNNLHVINKPMIVCSMGPEDWGLETTKLDVDVVVNNLNEHLEFLVNTGFPRRITEEKMKSYLNCFRDYGAMEATVLKKIDDMIAYIYEGS